MQNLTDKIRNNAIISYLFIFINIMFLYSKNNSNINNTFVKNHTKTAIIIHLWFLINTIIFVSFGLWLSTQIMWYNISDIIAITIYLILFWLLIMWAYKAYKWEIFKIWETIDFKKDKKLLDITDDWKFSEKDKLTILFSLIPFAWFTIYPKYKKNKLIENNTKLNLIISFLIIALYVFGNPNLANLLLLGYVIFIVFTAINLFIQNKVISLNLEKLPSPTDKLNYTRALKKYLWNYFKNSKNFENFSEILRKIKSENKNNNLLKEKELSTKPEFKLNNFIIYIPILNLISLFNWNVKQQKHIINWILITILFIIILTLNQTIWLNSNYLLFLLFPIFFWIWYLNANILNYEIPFLYSIFEIYKWIKDKIKSIFTRAKVLKNTEKSVSMKVWEKKQEDKKETKKSV